MLNYIKGPFYQQHDVNIISDNEISIFNNNNSISEGLRYSEVLIYNFKTKIFSRKFNPQLIENDLETKDTQGLSEILDDGSMLVEEQVHGRLILFNNMSDCHKMFSCDNLLKVRESAGLGI